MRAPIRIYLFMFSFLLLLLLIFRFREPFIFRPSQSVSVGRSEWSSRRLAESRRPQKIKYLMIRKNKKELYLDIDTKVLSAREKNLGVFIVLNSDHHADKETTLRDYRSRDAIEKMFDTLKTMTGNKRIRAASVDNAEGRVFLAFIAAILHNLFQEKLRKGGVLGKYSVKEALGMLRKIKTASLSQRGSITSLISGSMAKRCFIRKGCLPRLSST